MDKLFKSAIFLVLLFISIIPLQAQFIQGTKAIGGGLGYSGQNMVRQNTIEGRASTFYLNGNGGYLLEDNIEIGFNIGLSLANQSQTWNGNVEEVRSTLFQIGPYARLYNPITDVLALFGEGGFLVGFGGGSNDIRRRTFEAGVRPGVILMVNANIGLETRIGFIGYQRDASGEKDSYNESRLATNTFRANFDLSTINFGFRLYLRE